MRCVLNRQELEELLEDARIADAVYEDSAEDFANMTVLKQVCAWCSIHGAIPSVQLCSIMHTVWHMSTSCGFKSDE